MCLNFRIRSKHYQQELVLRRSQKHFNDLLSICVLIYIWYICWYVFDSDYNNLQKFNYTRAVKNFQKTKDYVHNVSTSDSCERDQMFLKPYKRVVVLEKAIRTSFDLANLVSDGFKFIIGKNSLQIRQKMSPVNLI